MDKPRRKRGRPIPPPYLLRLRERRAEIASEIISLKDKIEILNTEDKQISQALDDGRLIG